MRENLLHINRNCIKRHAHRPTNQTVMVKALLQCLLHCGTEGNIITVVTYRGTPTDMPSIHSGLLNDHSFTENRNISHPLIENHNQRMPKMVIIHFIKAVALNFYENSKTHYQFCLGSDALSQAIRRDHLILSIIILFINRTGSFDNPVQKLINRGLNLSQSLSKNHSVH